MFFSCKVSKKTAKWWKNIIQNRKNSVQIAFFWHKTELLTRLFCFLKNLLYFCSVQKNEIFKKMKGSTIITTICAACIMASCTPSDNDSPQSEVIFESGSYPYATFRQGNYYYTMQTDEPGKISLYVAGTPEELSKSQQHIVWQADSMLHIWSPEIHYINNKWYIYFEADDGNTDNHQLYVLENASADPLKGQFRMKGIIRTNEEWNFGLHPTSVIVGRQQYLLWSGWQHRRAEAETQCIFIARMQNPWTLDSERVMISQPEYEWERQWINPNGERSNYPILVNENPEAFVTPDGRHVCVYYSASGIWTVYATLGMLYASTDSNLLDPRSWTKCTEPQFVPDNTDSIHGVTNISLIPSSDGKQQMILFEAKWRENGQERRGIRMKPIQWNKEGLPDFGKPL